MDLFGPFFVYSQFDHSFTHPSFMPFPVLSTIEELQLLCNGLNRGDEAVPHIPCPGELSHLIPENPAV